MTKKNLRLDWCFNCVSMSRFKFFRSYPTHGKTTTIVVEKCVLCGLFQERELSDS